MNLTHCLLLGAALCALTYTPTPLAHAQPALTTVEKVDLGRYMGKWHEIALFPNRFQAQCIADTTATYVLQPDGRVEVTNRCRLSDGSIESIVGVARSAKGDTSGAKLQVRFAPWYLSFLPVVWGDYWVIELDGDYRFAVVSEPDRKFLWILSRTPVLDEATYQGILDRLTARGFDIKQLKKTPQNG